MKLPSWAASLALLVLLAEPGRGQDFQLGSLTHTAPASLPGHTRGILCQTDPGGPLRFSRDGFVMPNVYVLSSKDQAPHDFQYDARGDKIHLASGFRAMMPSDLSPSAPAYALADVLVNQGKGAQGLNGMLVSRCRPLKLDLSARIAALGHDVDRLARSYRSRIQPFFHQKEKGREERLTEATWLPSAHAVQVRFARSVSGRKAATDIKHGHRWLMWSVPYLTVCYRIRLDGHLISRVVVPPGDPRATARKYNPGGSPW
jgi:hypothetical protein